jgi:hypothetical protein
MSPNSKNDEVVLVGVTDLSFDNTVIKNFEERDETTHDEETKSTKSVTSTNYRFTQYSVLNKFDD